jgi:hypothetical protein
VKNANTIAWGLFLCNISSLYAQEIPNEKPTETNTSKEKNIEGVTIKKKEKSSRT